MPLRPQRTRLIFQLLGAYVLFQFFWWAFHIVQLHGEVKDLQLLMTHLTPEASAEIEMTYQKKVWMVIGEGVVFVSLLLFGIWRIGAALRKEAELARQERNFMLAVTHELKTPIATLRLFIDTMRSRELTRERTINLLNDASNETHRLDHLVDNILLSTRLENDDAIAIEHVSLSELVEDQVRKLEQVIASNHCLDKDVAEELFAMLDRHQMESVIINLIENAIKYSPEQSEVRIELRSDDDEIVFRVSDNGPGIPDAEKPNIFRKFYRVGNESTRRTKGTGLGLYLVEQIVRKHDGTVTVFDRIPGGSTFEVRIPQTITQ